MASSTVRLFRTQKRGARDYRTDAIGYSVHGARYDSAVFADLKLLGEDLRVAYCNSNPKRISDLEQRETLLGEFILQQTKIRVVVRTNRHAAIAFCVRPKGTGFQTVLLGVTRNPPDPDPQTWWRETILPRLKESLNV